MRKIKARELKEILRNHRMWIEGNSNGSRADLSGANLKRADLRGADLSDAYLRGADLSDAYLSGANLSKADLSGANLSKADLSRTDLTETNLSETNLSWTDLRCADLTEVNLNKAILKGADLQFTKNIIAFNLGRHHGFMTIHNSHVTICCQSHSLDYWLENFKSIGKNNNYTEEQIKHYGMFFKYLKEIQT